MCDPLLRTLYVLLMFELSFRATEIGAMRDASPAGAEAWSWTPRSHCERHSSLR